MKLLNIPMDEQETIIQIDRITGMANIYTNVRSKIRELDRKNYPRSNELIHDEQISGIEYEVPELLISFRTNKPRAKKKISPDNLQVMQAGLKKRREKVFTTPH